MVSNVSSSLLVEWRLRPKIIWYKTIEKNYKNVVIVTELASVNAIAFLVQGKEDSNEKDDYYSSKPFAAGGFFNCEFTWLFDLPSLLLP